MSELIGIMKSKGSPVSRAPRIFVIPIVLAALGAFMVAAPVQAQTVADCQVSIDQLHGATSAATFIGRNAEKDEMSLIGKLVTAADKLDQGKPDDALQPLTQYQAKVSALAVQGKLAAESAAALSEGVSDAIACVQGLATES